MGTAHAVKDGFAFGRTPLENPLIGSEARFCFKTYRRYSRPSPVVTRTRPASLLRANTSSGK